MAIDQFYKPMSISPSTAVGLNPDNIYNDLNPGYNYDPIPAGTTIIDHVTFLNAQTPDSDFVPTEYIATQDASNNITHLNIGVSNKYGGKEHPYETINTDNMIALTHPTLGVGVNVYDPSAIMSGIDLVNGHGFSPLHCSVLSTLDASRSRTLSIAFRTTGAKMSTTERNASTPRNGWIIYNSTSHTFQGYADGAWIDLH
jgi:hypothetical protein